LSYTDSTGASANAALTASAGVAGFFEIFQTSTSPITNGVGVRAPTAFIQSATRTSGTPHLVLFRPIAQIDVTTNSIGNVIDALTSGMPEIYPYSVLQLVFFPTTTTTSTIIGQYAETQG